MEGEEQCLPITRALRKLYAVQYHFSGRLDSQPCSVDSAKIIVVFYGFQVENLVFIYSIHVDDLIDAMTRSLRDGRHEVCIQASKLKTLLGRNISFCGKCLF